MALPIAVPTPYLPINPYVVPGSQTQPVSKQDYPIQSLSSGAGVKFASGQVLPSYAVKNVPQTNYSNVASAQATNAIPTKPTGYQQDSGFSMKYYPGWSEAEARADWNATGGAKASNYNYSTAAGADVTPTTYNIGGQNVTANTPSEAIKSIFPNTDYDKYAAEFNFDPSAFYSSIENEANSQYNFLDQQESALRQAQTDFQNLIQKDYETNFQKGATSKAIAESKLGESKVKAEQDKQNALNAAKQLYNQLSQGYQQRFGGTSGASEAARAILGQEQQRQGGKIQQDYGNTNRQIQQQQFELDTKYNDLVKELDLAKQKANYDALQNFQTNLASVNNNRTMTTQQKEQAKREILLQLRSDQNQIAATNLQFAQNLALMREEAKLQLQKTNSTIGNLADTVSQSGSNAANSFANRYQNITSSLSPSGTTNYSVQNTPITYENAVGQFSPAKAPSAEDLWKLGL